MGARDGIFPSVFGKVHPKYFTPHISIIAYAGLGYLLAVFGTLKQLVILSSAATLIIYLGVVLATIRLRYKKLPGNENLFTVPGGLTIPILATIIIIWMLSNLTTEEMIGTGIAILILSIIYVLMKWYKKQTDRLLLNR